MQIRPNFPSLVPQRSMQNSMAFPDTYPELEYHTSCVSFKSRNNVCRCFVYHIRDLRRNRRFISLSVAKSIATALVSSRLDYYNSLLYNTANKDIAELQRVQLFLARVVTHSPRLSRSVPLLKSLHWLPVHDCIIFKICTIGYQALLSTQPAFLNSMLNPARNSRQLCSTSNNPLYIPRVKTKART